MVVIEGAIHATIDHDHPTFAFASFPAAFSDLSVSACERYGADMKFFKNLPSAPADTPNVMVRVVDFKKKEFSYYWTRLIEMKEHPTNSKVIWSGDKELFLVFQKVKGENVSATYIKFCINREKGTITQLLNRSTSLDDSKCFIEESVFSSGYDSYFAEYKDNNRVVYFQSIDDTIKPSKTLEFPKEIIYTGEQVIVDDEFTFFWDGYAYFGCHKKDTEAKNSHLLRMKTETFDKKKVNKLNYEILKTVEILKLPGDKWTLQSYNKKWLLLVSDNGEQHFAIDLKNFTCKCYDFNLKQGDFPIVYGNSLVVFNNFDSKNNSFINKSVDKSMPLKFRVYKNRFGPEDPDIFVKPVFP